MPATALTVQEGGRNGKAVQLTFQALDSANGNFFLNTSGRVLLIGRTTGAAPLPIVLSDVKDPHGRQLTTAEKTITLDEDEVWVAGPFKPSTWNQRSGEAKGGILISIADATALQVAILHLND